jgi:glycosyltransferase involved in cell wall biosynthesis
MRILYVQASWVPPPEDLQTDRFFLLSEHMQGDVLHPIWFERPEQVEAQFGPGTYPEYTRAGFHYHWFLSFRYSGWRRRVRGLWFLVRKGLELHRRNRYDCIVVYSHMMPALAAVILKLLTGAKLIVEIMTAPELSYLYEHPRRTLGDRMLRLFSDISLHISVLMSDRVHLLYKNQLEHYSLLRRIPSSVFHDFVLVSRIRPADGDSERVVLFVGAPWYLKGADLAIQAFHKIADEFPDVTLRIHGYHPDRATLEALAAGSPRIEIVKPVANPEMLQRISRALLLAHPSRCDGLSRVVIEAMGAGVPVIASDAGGNPACIVDGETGFLFPSGNADALSQRLRQLLADGELRKRLGRKGYERAHTEFTEKAYVDRFASMIQTTVVKEP